MKLDGYKANYETVIRAVGDERLALVECRRLDNGGVEMVLCAVSGAQDTPEGLTLVPLAKLFHGDPYQEVIPLSAWEELQQAQTVEVQMQMFPEGGAQ